ncbi:MAG: T9SS type A sorting domain-containing protein [Daejeonella sp.]
MKKHLFQTLGVGLTGLMIILLGTTGETFAQQKKTEKIEKSIIITNGDTVINGKKLSEASKSERKKMLKEFDEMDNKLSQKVIIRSGKENGQNGEIIIRKGDNEPHVLRWKSEDDKNFEMNLDGKRRGMFKLDTDSMIIAFNGDSTMKGFRFKMNGLDSNMRKKVITLERSYSDDGIDPKSLHQRIIMDGDRGAMRMNNQKNSQNFSFSNTDQDGITTRLNIRVSELNKEQLKKVSGSEAIANELNVTDLVVFPNFSTGKIGLSFTLAAKEPVDFKLTNTEMKSVVSEKISAINGLYTKQLNLPMNGIYYLTIKQGNKSFIRKLIKE